MKIDGFKRAKYTRNFVKNEQNRQNGTNNYYVYIDFIKK